MAKRMKIKAELYAKKFGSFFENQECQILLSISDINQKTRSEFILSAKEAADLIESIKTCLDEKNSNKFGLKLV